MKTASLLRSASGPVLFVLGLAAGLSAEIVGDSPNRHEQRRTDLSGAPGMEVIASIVEYQPGETATVHLHHGVETGYVVSGSTVQFAGKEPVSMATGSTFLNLRDAKHGGFKVIGDQPLKLFTVHVVDKGKPLYDYSE
jgi:quercetin dioxygenase-like cupin family protein